MRVSDVIGTAIRDAFRSRLRTALTVMSLFVGAFTLTLTTALGAGVSDYVTRQVETLSSGDVLIVTPAASAAVGEGPAVFDPEGRQQSGQVNPLGAGTLLSQEDLDTMRGIAGIDRVEPVRQIAIDWITRAGSGQGARYELTVNPTSSIGRSDLVAGDQLDQQAPAGQFVLPEDYVEALGFASAEDAVGELVKVGYTDASGAEVTAGGSIAGIARTSLLASGAGVNQSLTDQIAQAQALPGQAAAYPVAIAYLSGSGEGVTGADIDAVKDSLTTADLAGQTVADQLGVIQTVINAIIAVLSAFAVVALIAAAFGIVNTLLMSVQDRTREIGLMKAMGMSNGRVFALFTLEAVVIGFLGAGLGAVAAFGLGSVISQVAATGPLANLPGLTLLLFQPVSVMMVILVIMLVAFLSGVLPARRAARQDPIESLRYE